MNKHTPGPWKVLEARTARGDHYGWSVWQDRERPYANSPRGNRICSTPDGTTKEAKANAQLIAAAPEMYAIIDYFVQLVEDGIETDVITSPGRPLSFRGGDERRSS